MDNRRVFTFLSERLAAGQAAVLVTVIAVEGSSMRGPGTHMGVAEDGSFSGSLSGGCIENAVISEALKALKGGAPRVVRFGTGSPYIDIKLPCGGGLDIHFLPLSDASLIKKSVAAIEARGTFSIELPLANSTTETTTIQHQPEPKLLIIGHGAAVPALAKLSRQMDLTVEVLTPDRHILEGLRENGVTATRLETPSCTGEIKTDPWTAIVFLFHDHDWEIVLMAEAMRQPHFYIGAMGGRKAHAFRTEALQKLGVADDAIAAICTPIGLFHSSRDPDTLALSTLAEVIDSYHQQGFGDVVE